VAYAFIDSINFAKELVGSERAVTIKRIQEQIKAKNQQE